jgi:membrane protein
MRKAWVLGSAAVRQWRNSRLGLQAAGLAFYLALSLGPLVIILTSIAGLFVGTRTAESDILDPLRPLIGGHATGAIRGLAATFLHRSSAVVPSGISLLVLFFAAAGVFEQLKETLDAIWEVPVRPVGVLSVVRSKFLSVVIVASAILVILLLLTASTLITQVDQDVAKSAPFAAAVAGALNIAVSLGIVTLLFGITFKLLPDAPVQWADVWFGAVCTACMFLLGQILIGVFLVHSGLESTFGRATAMVVILLWLYYSAQIFLFGAVLTRVHARQHDRGG